MVGDKHIRVDLEGKEEDDKNDFETSVFIGNLPWVVNEEELRSHFEDAGKILNVRVIRDKETFIGKGIAYIQFASTEDMKRALETKNNTKFKGRDLRVKRATPTERREKKQEKKREKKEHWKEANKDTKKKVRHHRKPREEVVDKKEDESRNKELKTITPFVQHARQSMKLTNDNVDCTSKIAVRGKKDKQKVKEQLLESHDLRTSRV